MATILSTCAPCLVYGASPCSGFTCKFQLIPKQEVRVFQFVGKIADADQVKNRTQYWPLTHTTMCIPHHRPPSLHLYTKLSAAGTPDKYLMASWSQRLHDNEIAKLHIFGRIRPLGYPVYKVNEACDARRPKKITVMFVDHEVNVCNYMIRCYKEPSPGPPEPFISDSWANVLVVRRCCPLVYVQALGPWES